MFILFLRCIGLWVIWLRHGRIGGMFKNDFKFRLSLSHVSSSFTVATQHATRIFWLSKSLKSIKSTIFGWFMSVCVCLSSWVCYIVGFIGLILFIHLPRCLRGLLCQPNCQKAVWPACEPSDNLGRGFMYENMFSIQQWMRHSNLTYYSTLSWLVTATGALTSQNCWFKCQVGCCKWPQSPGASSAIYIRLDKIWIAWCCLPHHTRHGKVVS